MTTPVCVRRRIRQLDRQGLSHKEISRRLGVSRTTVVRYANHGDYSPESSDGARAGGSLVDDGYAAVVDGWPAAGLRMPVKRRRAAARVYERLVGECGFTGPYSSVQRGSGVGGGASSAVGRLRRIEVGAGKRAGRFRPGPGRGRGRGTGRAFPGGVVPVLEHAPGGGIAGRDRGMRVPGSAGGVREDGHGAQGGGVRQRRRRGPPQRRRHGRPDPSVLPVPRALRVRAPVPRPVFRPREGRRGERGRLSRGATRWRRCRRPRASGRRSACGSTTSASWPPNAGSRPSSKRWRPSSTPDGPSTGPQSPHAPDASSRARAPRAARI